jgi:hypothetical protein
VTEAAEDTEPDVEAPFAVPVPVPDSVSVPEDALLGTKIRACNCTV